MAGFGLRLVRQSGVTDGYAGGLIEFPIDPANTNAMFTGDPVSVDAAGNVEAAAGGADFTITGVFMGCRFTSAEGDYEFKNQWSGAAGRTNAVAHVAVPAGGKFYIKGAAGTDYTGVGAGQRFGTIANAGSVPYGDSRTTLGAATVITGPLMIERLATLPNNDITNEPVFEVHVVRQQLYFTEA